MTDLNKAPEILPRPRKISLTRELVLVPDNKIISFSGLDSEPLLKNIITDWAGRNFFTIATEGTINLQVEVDKSKAFTYIDYSAVYTDEIYSMDVQAEQSGGNPGISVKITVSAARGLFNTLATLKQLLNRHSFTSCLIEDAPAFPLRAVIEGYYGSPWSQEERLEMLELLSDYKYNAYFYSPKDDVYHRERWRDQYPDTKLGELKELADRSKSLGLEFWYSLGPGLSMKYSSEEDFQQLISKFKQLYGVGIRSFGLLFDDIPEGLQHQDDRSCFTDVPDAHITIANRLYRSLMELDSSIRLVVCPTQYWGKGTEYYISKLGAGLDPRIDLFWTGPEICSRELTLSDASVFARRTSRPVLYWDNYPVNDLEMAHELHIGPYQGRDRHLYRASCGIVANAMEYAESSKIPLITVGDYLWNPEAYEPESSWSHALKRIAGEEDFQDFSVFADNSRYSCLHTTDSPYLSKTLACIEFENGYGDPDKARTVMQETIGQLKKAVNLFERGMKNSKLFKEIEPWRQKYIQGVALLEGAADYIEQPSEEKKKELTQEFDSYQSDKTYIFSDVLYPWIDSVLKKGES